MAKITVVYGEYQDNERYILSALNIARLVWKSLGNQRWSGGLEIIKVEVSSAYNLDDVRMDFLLVFNLDFLTRFESNGRIKQEEKPKKLELNVSLLHIHKIGWVENHSEYHDHTLGRAVGKEEDKLPRQPKPFFTEEQIATLIIQSVRELFQREGETFGKIKDILLDRAKGVPELTKKK